MSATPIIQADPVIIQVDPVVIQADPVIIQANHTVTTSEAGSSPNSTLYDKLGGPEALEAAVDLFYEKVLADERLKHFFEGTNMMRLVIKQVLLQYCNAVCNDCSKQLDWYNV